MVQHLPALPSSVPPPLRWAALVLCALGLSCGGGGTGQAQGLVSIGESHTTAVPAPLVQVTALFLQDTPPVPSVSDCAQGRGCPQGQTCALSLDGVPVCQGSTAPLPPVDAGTLTILGGSYPITLAPPYIFSGPSGAPFTAGAPLTVSAAGAQDAGFRAFSGQISATSYMKTSLDQLDGPTVFATGAAPLTITWTPGTDQVQVLTSGPGGIIVYDADDTSGRFDLQRQALHGVIGPDLTMATVNLEVTRTRSQTVRDVPVQGIPAAGGQVTLTTQSREGAAFQCRTQCGGVCIEPAFSNQNCGTCGNACSPPQVCTQGTCQTCTLADQARCGACEYCLDTKPSCADMSSACNQSAECMALRTCLGPCGTADCRRACALAHPMGTMLYDQVVACVCAPCQAACSASLLCTVYPL